MMRVVFVDDDADVLQGMKRTLRDMRNEWSMEFAQSGAAALEELKKAPTDVIVSDMRMPGMDGWELLAEVKKRYPQTVRLVLSGHADARSIMRAVGTAHQYLAKPCETTSLKTAIMQTLMLRQHLSSDRLAQVVGRVDMLPSAPKAFQEILACLQRPNASVAEAAKIITRDMAMTANVIKLVNSAFFGTRQPVSTADRAVAYLGLDTLGALVLGHGVFKSGNIPTIKGFSIDRLWQHSQAVAAAARTIALAERLPHGKADEAFLGGMLHDVGELVIATKLAETPDATPQGEDLNIQLQAHHAEVGAYLMGLWGFPNPIVEVVAFHDAPSQVPGDGLTLAKLVHIADRLVLAREALVTGKPVMEVEPGLLESLGLAGRWAVWLAELDTLSAAESAA
ncbi:MAG TPA: response regulator [Steroidobacteraceae bacterium]|jgi:HD-like signal output (HDOD) protein|nr:response regulator [Steroidobacteraceae bacterium]